MGKKLLHVVVWKEKKLYIAKLLEFELASQGETRDEAVKNLREALDLYLDSPDNTSSLPSLSPVQNVSTRRVILN